MDLEDVGSDGKGRRENMMEGVRFADNGETDYVCLWKRERGRWGEGEG